MTVEFSRPMLVEKLHESLTVEARPEECTALAARLQIPAVIALKCRFQLRRRGATVQAEGVLEARVVQSCVVSLDPVEQAVEDRFTIRFVPAGQETEDDDPDAPDELVYDGQTIDFGEAASEQLALSLDPYPRLPDAEMDPAGAEPVANPFGGLAALRPKP